MVICSAAGGTGGTVIFHYELINTVLLVGLGLILNVVSIVCFVFLYNMNRSNLKYCQTREMMNSYTLSLRFQLNENLKVMKVVVYGSRKWENCEHFQWLKNCIVVVAVVNITLAGFLIGFQWNSETIHLFICSVQWRVLEKQPADSRQIFPHLSEFCNGNVSMSKLCDSEHQFRLPVTAKLWYS